jgi:hypothetical protein
VGLLGFMYGKQVSQRWHYVKENGMPRHEPCKSGDLKVQKRAWKEADGSVWDEKFGHKQTLVP